MALHVVMALVGVLVLMAASMAALSSMNLNLATSYTNGQVALNEAEAGVSKLMYVLNDNPKYGFPGSSSASPPPSPPDVEIHGRLTPGFTDSECFHWVTFRRDRGVPWSVNNFDGSWSQGYGGRTVPKAMINAFSTGYCRGQYRTIELVVEHPTFPYALATSGRIQSATSLIVQGTASSSAFGTGDTARPGHVVSNFVSADPTIASIVIGTSGSTPTNITGFVQACGAVRIAQPATVRGGIFANTAALRLPAVDVRTYKNQGQEGVVTITSGSLDAQTLDTMYYCGHNLTVDGGITLKNGFLYVDGGLTVTNGGIKGVGAIVVNGDVLVQGDELFSASHRVALLASGDVNLQGNGNYLQGLVYAGGSLSAKKLTVLGNVVVNNPDPTKGATNLDQVRIVSNPETASFSYTAASSQGVTVAGNPVTCPYPLKVVNQQPTTLSGILRGTASVTWIIGSPPEALLPPFGQPTTSVLDVTNISTTTFFLKTTATALPPQPGLNVGNIGRDSSVVVDLTQMSTAEAVKSLMTSFRDTGNLSFYPVGLAKLDSNNPYAQELANSAQRFATSHTYLQDFFTALVNYMKAETPTSGSPGTTSPQVVTKGYTYTFDVNAFLPLGEGMKVVLWHVHHVPP